MTAPIKTCACGKSYTREEWGALPSLGVMDDGDTGGLLLKNCTGCDSTMALPTDDPQAARVAA